MTHYMLNADVQPSEREGEDGGGEGGGRLGADSWIYGCWEADDQPVVRHVSPAAPLIVLQPPLGQRNQWIEALFSSPPPDEYTWMLASGPLRWCSNPPPTRFALVPLTNPPGRSGDGWLAGRPLK